MIACPAAFPLKRGCVPASTSFLPRLALVMPVFNEEPVLPELFSRLAALFDAHPSFAWQAILVDDGSRDKSVALISAQTARDPRFQLVRLSRNFGFQAAMMAGLETARDADAVVTMDADLQDPPELIPELAAAWRGGAEVVLAVRRSRQENGLRRLGFELFHRTFSSLVDHPVEPNTGTFGLMDRVSLHALLDLPERNRFFPALRAWVGFEVARVAYDRQERFAGQPGQTFSRLVRYALDGIFSFSYLPLRLVTYAGVLAAGIGFATSLYFALRRLLGQEIAFTGFTTLVCLVLFLGGLQLIGIGVLGEYLGRIYDEVKKRPHYIVRRPPPSA
ncbi:MAG: glycosyltransferase family 2 protein [Opitutaceae bacterium]|nr:glycosyltransferase family 2 protein [Opitutaceae bacterium]